MVIEVSFKGNRREFFEWPFEDVPAVKTAVVVEVERGEDLGHVHATGELALKRKAGTTHGKATTEPLRKAIRAATGEEIVRAAQLRADEVNVRTRAIEKVRTLGLDLKVSDTEWQWDKKRLTIYFTAEQRVDFRQLVRQLEGLFGTRVHMWHIGVRDEAKRVDGVGRCGRQLCSANWLPELIPVKSSVAKDQHLSTLNPAQISGACGRLMCCLRYEHEFYVQQRKRFPKEGKIVTTAAGEEKVISLDIFRETVTLRSPVGESRVVPLAQLRQEMSGEPVTVVDAGDEAATDETHDESGEETAHVATHLHTHDAHPEPPRQQQPQRSRDDRQQNQQQNRPQDRQQRPSDQRQDRGSQRDRQQRPQQDRPQHQRPQHERQPQQQRPPQDRQHRPQQDGRQQARPDQQRPQEARPEQQNQQQRAPQQPPAQGQPARQANGQPQGDSAEGQGGGRRRRRGRRGGRRGGGGGGNRGPGEQPGGGGNPPNDTPPSGGNA